MDLDKKHLPSRLDGVVQHDSRLSDLSECRPIPFTSEREPSRFYDFVQHHPQLLHLLTRWKSVRGLHADYLSSVNELASEQGVKSAGQLERYRIATTEADYARAGNHYRSLGPGEREVLVANLVKDLKQCTKDIQLRMVWHFWHCDGEYGRLVAEGAGIDLEKAKRLPPLLGRAAQNHAIRG